ncbi:MAG: hypothetical protein QNJ00_10425 [Woeseiaceae bacterium]|nr:hypothetical protein [Woeseiaceae bacterium]
MFEFLQNAAATIDYAGMLFFGSEWSLVSPGIEQHTDSLARFFNDVFGANEPGCRYASLGGGHA